LREGCAIGMGDGGAKMSIRVIITMEMTIAAQNIAILSSEMMVDSDGLEHVVLDRVDEDVVEDADDTDGEVDEETGHVDNRDDTIGVDMTLCR
jgi:hypothetical protein